MDSTNFPSKHYSFCCFVIAIILIPMILGAQWPSDPTENVPISRDWAQEMNPIPVSDGADGAIITWLIYNGSATEYDILAQRVGAGGNLSWASSIDICSASYTQNYHQVISDGAGGAIITWVDQRNELNYGDIYAQRVDGAGNVKWTVNGIAICKATDIQGYPQLTGDGSGGAIIVWRDSRNYLTLGLDIYAQRINASGQVTWATNGIAICNNAADQSLPVITGDGSGGAIIAWMDTRDTALKPNIYCQRINSSGVAQWTANGVGYMANGTQSNPQIVSDGASGALVTWTDDYFGVTDTDIRGLRIKSDGTFAWTPGSISIGGWGGNQDHQVMASDGSGGAIVAWQDYRNGVQNPDIYAQRFDGSGNVLWAGGGQLACNAQERQIVPRLVADDFGGAVLTWQDDRNSAADVFAQRLDGNGSPQWQSNGIEVSSAQKAQNLPCITKAGTCGAIITWTDQRWLGDPYNDTEWDIYAQRVYCDGKLAQHSITLDVPNGSETWTAGSDHIIVWHGSGIDNYDVKIEYSTDNKATYNFVTYVTNHGTTGSYTWEIPDSPSQQCYIRVSVLIPPEISDESDAAFTIGASIMDNTPSGNDVEVNLGGGNVITFDNVSSSGLTELDTLNSGHPPPAELKIYPSNPPEYYIIETTASYSGNINVSLKYDDTGLEIEKEEALTLNVYESSPGQWTDITSNVDTESNTIWGSVSHLSEFAIMVPAGDTSITVIAPNGSEEWLAGSEQEIHWQSSGIQGKVRIRFSPDYTQTYFVVTDSTENDGSFLWTVPEHQSDQCLVVIEDLDGEPWDMSDGVFTIMSESGSGKQVVTNTNDAETGSLREAINNANQTPEPDTIIFQIPDTDHGYDPDVGVWTIAPQSELPIITDHGLLIDGFSQNLFIGEDRNPNGPDIQIKGTNAGDGADGFIFNAMGARLIGLIINDFSGSGIVLDDAQECLVSACYLGLSFDGFGAMPNSYGITIQNNSRYNHIVPLDTIPNFISGNSDAGILLWNYSMNNTIEGNIIGQRTSGQPLGNGLQGIAIFTGSDSNSVFGNKIIGNDYGIYISESDANKIIENGIGTNETWDFEPGMGEIGIVITDSSKYNRILHNMIGFHNEDGVYVDGEHSYFNTISLNSIANNQASGIDLVNGANMGISPPVITSLAGELIEGSAGPFQTIECFLDMEDEGRLPVGSTLTDEGGIFVMTMPQVELEMPFLTMTATDTIGNTSEFSVPQNITGIDDPGSFGTAGEFFMNQNYPNPFNPATRIEFSLREAGHVDLTVYDVLGQEVMKVVDKSMKAGHHWLTIMANDLGSGIYFYRLTVNDFTSVKKMMLLK